MQAEDGTDEAFPGDDHTYDLLTPDLIAECKKFNSSFFCHTHQTFFSTSGALVCRRPIVSRLGRNVPVFPVCYKDSEMI